MPQVDVPSRHGAAGTGAFLSSLEGSLDAAGGHGCMALVGGEAGIGKTSLVRAFCERHGADARVLWGACDALRTPRPLGPLLDVAREAGGELAGLVAAEPARHRLFSAFLDLLGPAGRTPPVIAVVEDAHWADEATLDLLVFVGRRVAGVPAMVVVTYRDDEVGPAHPWER
jgi:predicted ATPase